MPRLVLDLPAEVSVALRKAAYSMDMEREAAATALLMEILSERGFHEPVVLDGDRKISWQRPPKDN